ncbi:MAG: DUF1351 domain-containing protein [Atopobiaceae bacterium]|nr:DUF1351 domain-containing protein [Atopobiaceae bacterium]
MSVEEVDARVVDSDVRVLGEADKWLAETMAVVAEKAAQYEVYPITTNDQYRQAKRDRAAVRKDKAELDAQRKGMTRTIEDAIRQFKAGVKDVLDPLTAIDEGIKEQLDLYEDMETQRKRAELQQAFEDAAPDIALPINDDRPLVSFDTLVRVFGQGTLGKKWMLFGTPEKVAEEQLLKALHLIAEAEKTIDDTVQEDDRAAVKAAYFANLDLQEALTEARNIKAQRERLAALEAERVAREEEFAAHAEQPDELSGDQPSPEATQSVADVLTARSELLDDMVDKTAQPMYGDDVPEYVLFAYVPEHLRDKLVAFCKQNGIKGAFRPTRGKRFRLMEVD